MDPDSLLLLDPHGAPWPAPLAHIEGAPRRLWAKGRVELLEGRRRLAIVGTRSPTPYGADQARRFASAFAERGVCIVSGLARGVDEAAHHGALDVGGDTIAVLGSGLERPWPTGPLLERMEREGLLLSELAPQTPPRRHHFPLRNRIISGLAEGVLVVEAAYASGSLITARWATDQGRTVAALPGRVDHPMARGCHRLLREGAALVETPADLARELGWEAPEPPRERAPIPGTEDLLRALEGETLSPEELARRVQKELSRVLVDLVRLEMDGRVARAPGGLYRLL